MGILLVHDQHENAQISLSEGIVGGEHTPVRRYQQDGRFLNVNIPPNALEHDLDQLRQLGYRQATPNEMNEYTKHKKQAATLLEKGGRK
jgi:hypothetical protein